MSDSEFLRSCSRQRVSMYLRTCEAYGIQSFTHSLRDHLEDRGVRTAVLRVGFVGLVLGLLKDRRAQSRSVLSTWHGLLGFLNRSGAIYVLHGFPTKDYGLCRFMALWLVQLLSARLASIVIANSGLTHAVNAKIFRIGSHIVWNPLRAGRAKPDGGDTAELSRRPRRIAFVGRAIAGKHAFEAAEAFLRSQALSTWSMAIIGRIEDDRLERLAIRESRLELVGTLPHAEVLERLRDVRVVISLNPLEPYGFVYQEGAAAGAVIVAPPLAGAVEDLRTAYASRLVLLRDFSTDALADALEEAARRTDHSARESRAASA